MRVTVGARLASLLGNGPGSWDLGRAEGAVEVATGQAGTGMLLVEVTARTRRGSRRAVRVRRTRHRLDVS